tara:strand:+ start:90 stop:776 length:687 start_codon:yes stop_codon:yes gene_type:complete
LKKIIYILIFISTTVFISCKTVKKSVELKSFLNKMISENEKIAKIKFNKYNSDLVDDIESQLKIDLCDRSNFIALSNTNGLNIKFPAFVLKECDYFTSVHGVVTIQINSNNETLVDNEFVSSGSNIENEVLEATRGWMQNEYRKRLVYLISWDSLTKPTQIENKLKETLFAVKSYSDSIAISKFKKKVAELNLSEIKTLKDKFDFKVGFRGYKMPTPPPPPPESKDIE